MIEIPSLEELAALFAEMPVGHRFMLPRTRKRDVWPDPQWPAQPIDDHLSVEQRAEQWCARHHVRVWEQEDPFALVFQKLTPTGRWRCDAAPEMQAMRHHISNPAVIVVSKDTDFAALEMRYLKHDPTKRHSRRQGKGARRGD